MKPILLRHVETTTSESFKVWKNANPYTHNPWHYHPECEITLIDEGIGVLFAGDCISHYRKNDLVLIGPNLPHEFRASQYHSPDFKTRSTAIHFRWDFPGAAFYKIPEAKIIYDLLNNAKRGIKINDSLTQEVVKMKIAEIFREKGINRINILFSILQTIADSSEHEYLSSQVFIDSIQENADNKMYWAYKFIMNNFREKISQEQLAKELNMTSSSFSRFFKKRTHKSFVDYVNEIRIGYACKLLLLGDQNISGAAYESGFENISNFNKQFLRVKGFTPSQYLKTFISDKEDKGPHSRRLIVDE